MSKDNNVGDNNVTELNTEGKPTKSFKDLLSNVTGELASSKIKAAQAQVKAILEKKLEAQKLIRGYDEELDQLQAKFEKGLL